MITADTKEAVADSIRTAIIGPLLLMQCINPSEKEEEKQLNYQTT